MDFGKLCQEYFDCALPSIIIEKRETFEALYDICCY